MSLRQNLTNEDQPQFSPDDDQNLQRAFKPYQGQGTIHSAEAQAPRPETRLVVLGAEELRDATSQISSAVATRAVSKVSYELDQSYKKLSEKVIKQDWENWRLRTVLQIAFGVFASALILLTWPYQSDATRGVGTNALFTFLHWLALLVPAGTPVGIAFKQRRKLSDAQVPAQIEEHISPERSRACIEEAIVEVLDSDWNQTFGRMRSSHPAESSFMDFILSQQ